MDPGKDNNTILNLHMLITFIMLNKMQFSHHISPEACAENIQFTFHLTVLREIFFIAHEILKRNYFSMQLASHQQTCDLYSPSNQDIT